MTPPEKTPPPPPSHDLTPPQTPEKEKEILAVEIADEKKPFMQWYRMRGDPPDRDHVEVVYKRESNGFEYEREEQGDIGMEDDE